MLLKIILTLVVITSMTESFAANNQGANVLIKNFEALNNKCLSDDAEKPDITSACDKRDAIYEKLKKSNLCLGPENMQYPLRTWMKCSEMEKPELIRLFAMMGNQRLLTGDTVPPRNVTYRLYLERKCSLPIQDAEDMRYFYQYAGGITRYGCWYPTLDNGFTIVYHDGTRQKQPSWQVLPKANLNKDGSATIIEADYDSETFTKKVYDKLLDEKLKNSRYGIH